MEYKSNECIICLDEFGDDDIAILACMHKYHYNCLKNWLSYNRNLRCPECYKHARIVCITGGIEISDISSETTSDSFQEIEEKGDCCCIIS